MWRLRGYVIEGLLGAGATAEVWRARVAATGEPVALKRLPLPDAARARAEAAMLSALDHPHLVRLHALVPGPDVLSVLVLDLAEGGSLADLLAARGRLTPGEVITAVSPIAAALSYLHTAGVVHGDVSAANILFTPGGVPLLADLGVARLTGDDSDAESTPAYVDPAVADGCVPGATSDVFMIGAVALHALTGIPPWPGCAEEAIAAAQAERIGDVAARLAACGVPPEMTAVIVRALDMEPYRRGTAAEFALELRHSGEPLAVELGAGRPRPAGRVASSASGGADDAHPPPSVSASDVQTISRAWTGPRHAALVPTAPPTRALGPRPRPSVPRSRPRGRWLARHRAVIVAAVGVMVGVVVALMAGGAVLLGDRSKTPRPAGGTHSSSPSPSRSAQVPVTWAARLNALDALRAEAFADHRPDLLRQVYVPGPLLSADTRLLMRLVPAGCGLVGVRTSYHNVRVRRSGSAVELTVLAALPQSQLRCGGRPAGFARASGPTSMRVRLQRVGNDWRIAEQSVV